MTKLRTIRYQRKTKISFLASSKKTKGQLYIRLTCFYPELSLRSKPESNGHPHTQDHIIKLL